MLAALSQAYQTLASSQATAPVLMLQLLMSVMSPSTPEHRDRMQQPELAAAVWG